MSPLAGASADLRLLVVEDEAIVAMLLDDMLRILGIDILGPAGDVDQALRLIDVQGAGLSGAILDVNLGNEPVYPVARRLEQAGIPFAFITGYGLAGLDPAYARQPVIEKPFELADLENLIVQHFAPKRPR